jgi:hypothetical protein
MRSPQIILTIITSVLLTGIACKPARPIPPFAIRDYPDTLQPWLTRAINTGIVGYDTATKFIETHATDSEISMLSLAENPILRSIALYQMTHCPRFNHNQVMFTHLDDTAIIFEDVGEWGIQPWSVTDYMIGNGRWKTEAARDNLANEVILHHDGLRSAYTALQFATLRPEYHDHLTRMIQRDKDYSREIEYALYALAKYKRKEDIPSISNVLSSYKYRFTGASFQLMRDYPDPAYLDILEEYYPRRFYHAICRDQNTDLASSYIEAVASYKTDTCAKILSAILTRKPFMPCTADTITLKEKLLNAIWNNPCPAYAALRARVATEVRRLQIRDSLDRLSIDPSWRPEAVTDTSAEPVRWR